MSAVERNVERRSGHDVGFLLDHWEELIAKRGWKKTLIHNAGDWPVFAVENGPAEAGEVGGIYVSAGVHGDECAPPWALLEWAESHAKELGQFPFLIFPCLNPQGIAENTRVDGGGIDLNRNFQNAEIPIIAAWQNFLAERKFRVAVNLHEDYDATGTYLYELARSHSIGHRLLSACEKWIARETVAEVDGSEFDNGLLCREVDENVLRQVVEEDLEGGWPEAIWLYLDHTEDSFTFETPSELELSRRIAAHREFLDEILIASSLR